MKGNWDKEELLIVSNIFFSPKFSTFQEWVGTVNFILSENGDFYLCRMDDLLDWSLTKKDSADTP